MALTKIRKINGLSDPLRQYQCKFHISRGLGTLLSAGKSSIIRKEDFELRATSWTIPGTIVRTVDTVVFNHYRRRPSIQDKSGTWRVSVVEDMKGHVLQSIRDWCDTIMNPYNGAYGVSEEYISEACVEICDQNMHHTNQIFLKGFYPIRIGEIKIDPSSSQVVTVDIDFNYDWYTETSLNWAIANA